MDDGVGARMVDRGPKGSLRKKVERNGSQARRRKGDVTSGPDVEVASEEKGQAAADQAARPRHQDTHGAP